MSDLPSPRTVEHWCAQIDEDLSWMMGVKARDLGRSPAYNWAHSGLDNLRSPQYQSIGHTGLSDPTGATTMRPPSRELARVREAASLVQAAQKALRAARRLLETNDEEQAERGPVGLYTSRAEMSELEAAQARRNARGGYGAS